MVENLNYSTCKMGVIKHDFLKDTLIAGLNVPCKLYNIMQYIVWCFAWHYLLIISSFMHSVK